MKPLFSLLFLAVAFGLNAQEHYCAKMKQRAAAPLLHAARIQKTSASVSGREHRYDLKFVHLDLQVENNTKYISGNAKLVAKVSASSLDTFLVLLDLNLSIDSVRFNGANATFTRQDSMVLIKPAVTLGNGATFTAQVWYKGFPPAGGSAIGDGFSNDVDWDYGQGATWSLSESFVAYHWWPSKQVLTDKIDSSWVFVTTDSINMAGSNGVLENVVSLGAKKRYEWKSRTPIDYYLISVAVSDYKEYNLYAKPKYLNDSILIQNFVYSPCLSDNAWINSDKIQLDRVPEALEFYSGLYGMYPFYKEKYGHCMVPIGGGMEHQTMTSQGFFFSYSINVHELAHQWWGNSVTCKSWGDIWINEGFASYSEHLAMQYLRPASFKSHLSSAHTDVMKQPGGSIHFSGADTLNSSRIFSTRLTYDKGGVILHSLRFLTNNDSVWFNTLRDFQATYKNSTASAVDFKNFYHTKTGIDPTQFFSQWYYGEGYPTFNVKYNFGGGKVYLNVTQSTSASSVTPLFITPIEYRITRNSKPDTIVRVIHDSPSKSYTFALDGTVNNIHVDPDNWILNKTVGPVRDVTLGVEESDLQSFFELITVGPNPSFGKFVVYNPVSVPGQIRVSDLNGRILVSAHLKNAEQDLDLSTFSDGVYFVQVLNTEGEIKQTRKLVKQ